MDIGFVALLMVVQFVQVLDMDLFNAMKQIIKNSTTIVIIIKMVYRLAMVITYNWFQLLVDTTNTVQQLYVVQKDNN